MTGGSVDVVAWAHATQTVDLSMLADEVRGLMTEVQDNVHYWEAFAEHIYVAGDEVMDLAVRAQVAAQAVHDRLSAVVAAVTS